MSRRASPGDRGARRDAMAAMGLAVRYIRAEGSRMWREDASEPVWDFLGGFGSTLFGHNHPELTATVTGFLGRRGVAHGQASIPVEAEALADELGRRVEAALGRSVSVLFASTGSEAVEVAARHAAECHRAKVAALRRVLVPPGVEGMVWIPEALAMLRRHGVDPSGGAGAVRRYNARILARPAAHLAVRRGYHGMTQRALSLTEDRGGIRHGRPRSGRETFLAPTDPDAVDKAVSSAAVPLLRLRVLGSGLGVEEQLWCPYAALFVEPLQGEGGIHPLAPDVATSWRASCTRHGIHLVADEIQSGCGRTGSFLYSTRIGLDPDVVLLGKSLGGGLAKISAIAVSDACFRRDFTLRYASTFAEDGLAAAVARRTLRLLDETGAEEVARRKGARLLQELRALAEAYPAVVLEVRGEGLMLGVELRSLTFERSNLLDFLDREGWLGYAAAGYLLHRHRIRVAPALSGGTTLRIEPAYDIPESALERLLEGLRDLCAVLQCQDAAQLLSACLDLTPPRDEPVTPPPRVVRSPEGRTHVGFVGHLIDTEDVALWDPSLSRLDVCGRSAILDAIHPFVEPVLIRRDHLSSALGEEITFSFYGLAMPSGTFHAALRSRERYAIRALVRQAVDRAVADGCTVVGLGGYSSIITRNGRDVVGRGARITTGNGLTAAAGFEAMRMAAEEAGVSWFGGRAAVVGAGGNIGRVMAELLLQEVGELVLVGREGSRAGLEARAFELLQAAFLRGAGGPVARRLRELGWSEGNGGPPLAGALSGDADAREHSRLYRRAVARWGEALPVRVACSPDGCREAGVVVAASNHPGSLLEPRHLAQGPVLINDLAVPSDVTPEVEARENVRIIRGGVVRTYGEPDWSIPGIPLPPGEMYACMAETALMGFGGEEDPGSVGPLSVERVRAVHRLAQYHGFGRVRATAARSY